MTIVRIAVPDLRVTLLANADIRLGTESVIILAFRGTARFASESVRVQKVIRIADTNVRLDARTVDTTVRAHRHAQMLVVRIILHLVTLIARAHIRLLAGSLYAGWLALRPALVVIESIALAARVL